MCAVGVEAVSAVGVRVKGAVTVGAVAANGDWSFLVVAVSAVGVGAVGSVCVEAKSAVLLEQRALSVLQQRAYLLSRCLFLVFRIWCWMCQCLMFE